MGSSMADSVSAGVTLTAVKGCLVATLHADLHDTSFEQIRAATLDSVYRQDTVAVIFDLSAVRLLDQCEFEQLRALAAMLRLLGCRTVLVGLSAGLVAYLVSQDLSISGIEVARGLEEALDRLIPQPVTGKK